jgi:PadR family transcriptional regulator AphA
VELSLAEHVCLALVAEGAGHGWAIGSLLAPGGELGRIWTLSRPLTYRALDSLAAKQLVARTNAPAGQGRDRVVNRATARGRRENRAWLDAPVDHLRDVRTELLVKLALRDRAGLERAPLLGAQAEHFAPLIAALSVMQAGDDDDLVALWRREHARAVRRFLAEALRPPDRSRRVPTDLRLSARNQLSATVTAIKAGDVMATVAVVLPDGQRLTAAITRDAAEELDLAVGDQVTVIVKSTEVMIATGSV